MRRDFVSSWTAALVFFAAPAASAQTDVAFRASGRVEAYVDSDATRVARPRVSFDGRVSDRVRLATTYTADVVTSASIDVVTRATQAIRDDRHEVTATTTLATRNDARVSVGYAFGTEVDYRSHSGSVSYTADLDEAKLWNLVVRTSIGHSRIGSADDTSFDESVIHANASVLLTRVVRASTVLRTTLDLANAHGFQSSAYRTVRIGDWSAYRYTGTDPDAGQWVFVGVVASARERVPEERFRGRLGVDFLEALGERFALAITAAGYADSWRVLAGELVPELRYEPRAGLLLRLGGRIYEQTGAWFWRRRYESVDETNGYVTDDKELGPMRSYDVHAAIQVPFGDVRVDARAEVDFFRYPEFTLLPEKRAFVASIGVVYAR